MNGGDTRQAWAAVTKAAKQVENGRVADTLPSMSVFFLSCRVFEGHKFLTYFAEYLLFTERVLIIQRIKYIFHPQMLVIEAESP